MREVAMKAPVYAHEFTIRLTVEDIEKVRKSYPSFVPDAEPREWTLTQLKRVLSAAHDAGITGWTQVGGR